MAGKGQLSSKEIFALEDQYGCRNYGPIPVALTRGEGKQMFSISQMKLFVNF